MQLDSKQTFAKGAILMREGDAGDCAYVIESGNVEIFVEKSGRLVPIGTRGAGSIIGEMAMIDDRPRTAAVRAMDECSVLRISREDFTRRVNAADPVVKAVMHVIMTRYRDLMAHTQIIRLPHDESLLAEKSEHSHAAHALALGSLKMHDELRHAIQNNELTLFYQPIIDLKTLKIAGFEALMRWIHPQKGMVSPGVFIPVAEQSGLIGEMTPWALRTACAAVKDLQKTAGNTQNPVFVSVNFSVKDFSGVDMFAGVEKTLRETNTNPAQIHLEITESLLMEEPESAKKALARCRDAGLHVSIDDFGSGYSSLSYLHHFPIDTLKIDQSFVRAMTSHEASLVLVKSIIGLARNLGMRVIAEGIESAEEARILSGLGCEYAQGFWFAKPMPLDAAQKCITHWTTPKLWG